MKKLKQNYDKIIERIIHKFTIRSLKNNHIFGKIHGPILKKYWKPPIRYFKKSWKSLRINYDQNLEGILKKNHSPILTKIFKNPRSDLRKNLRKIDKFSISLRKWKIWLTEKSLKECSKNLKNPWKNPSKFHDQIHDKFFKNPRS